MPGELLGHHYGNMTDSDVAVRNMHTNTLVSFFDVMDNQTLEN